MLGIQKFTLIKRTTLHTQIVPAPNPLLHRLPALQVEPDRRRVDLQAAALLALRGPPGLRRQPAGHDDPVALLRCR